MYPSASLCRTQESFHRDRANGAGLANVRVIAAAAADAWGQEALAAERREARRERTKTEAAVIALRKHDAIGAHERLFSENPDRGFESA
jgi:hypothetical protein